MQLTCKCYSEIAVGAARRIYIGVKELVRPGRPGFWGTKRLYSAQGGWFRAEVEEDDLTERESGGENGTTMANQSKE